MFEVGGNTCNNAFQLAMQHCCVQVEEKCCPYYRALRDRMSRTETARTETASTMTQQIRARRHPISLSLKTNTDNLIYFELFDDDSRINICWQKNSF